MTERYGRPVEARAQGDPRRILVPGSFLPRPPEGYSARQRTEVEGFALDALDDAVRDVGGWIEYTDIETPALRPGRLTACSQRASWYVIPNSALEP